MYRKIIFISINFLKNLPVFSKAALILLLSAISTLLTLFYKPFVYKELNDIELYSNLSIMITIFSGALYVQEVLNDSLRAFLFFWILFVNTSFGIYWVTSCFGLFFYSHFGFIFKHFPNITKNVVAFHEALVQTKFEINIIKYTSTLLLTTKNIANDYHKRLSGSEQTFVKQITCKVQKLRSIEVRKSIDEFSP